MVIAEAALLKLREAMFSVALLTRTFVVPVARLKSALSKLQSSLAGLRDAAGLDARSATSSDATLFSATAQPQSAQGSYAVQVLNLAKAQKLVSTDFSDGGALTGIAAKGLVSPPTLSRGSRDAMHLSVNGRAVAPLGYV